MTLTSTSNLGSAVAVEEDVAAACTSPLNSRTLEEPAPAPPAKEPPRLTEEQLRSIFGNGVVS